MTTSTWGDLLSAWRPQYLLCSTATTGLRRDEGAKLIGCFFAVVTAEGDTLSTGEVLYPLTESELEQSAGYHRVTPTRLRNAYKTSEEATEELLNLAASRPVFSYSPAFQQQFLPFPFVNDVLKLYALAVRHMPVAPDPVYQIISKYTGPVPKYRDAFAALGLDHEVVCDDIPATAIRCKLQKLWDYIMHQQVLVLE